LLIWFAFHRFERSRTKDFLSIRRAIVGLEKEISERNRIEAERKVLIDGLETKDAELERFT